jgi:hypothetical protein
MPGSSLAASPAREVDADGSKDARAAPLRAPPMAAVDPHPSNLGASCCALRPQYEPQSLDLFSCVKLCLRTADADIRLGQGFWLIGIRYRFNLRASVSALTCVVSIVYALVNICSVSDTIGCFQILGFF